MQPVWQTGNNLIGFDRERHVPALKNYQSPLEHLLLSLRTVQHYSIKDFQLFPVLRKLSYREGLPHSLTLSKMSSSQNIV